MKVDKNKDLLLSYMSMAPLALALERYLEARIYRTLPIVSPVLDIGCGEGLFAHLVFDSPLDTGIDPNAHEIKRARQLNGYEELIVCSGSQVPKPDASYQTIICNSVLEHIPNIGSVLKEIHRLLAPGGSFYMTVPAPEFEKYTVGNSLLTAVGLHQWAKGYRAFCSKVLWKQMHYKSLEEWKGFVQAQGFKVVEGFSYDSRKICLMNDFFYPFSLFSVIVKKITNRWVLFPCFRSILIYPLFQLLKGVLNKDIRAEDGGLVFLSLKKAGPC